MKYIADININSVALSTFFARSSIDSFFSEKENSKGDFLYVMEENADN